MIEENNNSIEVNENEVGKEENINNDKNNLNKFTNFFKEWIIPVIAAIAIAILINKFLV